MEAWAEAAIARGTVDQRGREEIESELQMRKIEPFGQIKARGLLRPANKTLLEELERDPDRLACYQNKLNAAIEQFKAAAKTKRN
ncbi:MAG: hypothetical protein WBE48_20565 [Xanthobacteraceae bacterium]